MRGLLLVNGGLPWLMRELMNDRVSRRKQLVDRGLPPQHGEIGCTILQKCLDLRSRCRWCCFFGELKIAK